MIDRTCAVSPIFSFSVNSNIRRLVGKLQISAVRSEDAANEAWSRLAQRHPEIFAGARKSVERADLGARGVFYRLRAGSFETREAASRFCDAYKQAGGDCIIVREE